MSRPTFIIFFSQVVCLHESFRKSVKGCQTAQEVGWRQTGPYGRSYDSRERGEHLDKLARLFLGLNKERIEKAGESTEVNGWAESYKVLKWNQCLSSHIPMEMAFCALHSKPRQLFSNPLSNRLFQHLCANLFFRCIFINNGQNLSLKLQLWNSTWYLCL